MKKLLFAALALALAGCGSHPPVPVVDRTGAATAVEPAPAQPEAAKPAAAATAAATDDRSLYTVKKGDTLYSIAVAHDQDYKDIAAWNGIDNPNRIQVGQQLRVAPPDGQAAVAVARPIASSAPVAVKPVEPQGGGNTETFKREPKGGKSVYSEQVLARLREPAPVPTQPAEKPLEKSPPPVPTPAVAAPPGEEAATVDWTWPAAGKTLANFTENGAAVNKGIDIAGNTGDPVHAAAAGKVVYVGNGLRGYGNLVIVRHNPAFLSAYAYNSKILVKEGQAVARGQKIAEIGNSDTDQARLHFEIRHLGKPVDPLRHLPPR